MKGKESVLKDLRRNKDGEKVKGVVSGKDGEGGGEKDVKILEGKEGKEDEEPGNEPNIEREKSGCSQIDDTFSFKAFISIQIFIFGSESSE